MKSDPIGERVSVDFPEPIAERITNATVEWMRQHPNGGDFESLKAPFELLLSHITTTCSWAITSVKSGASPRFFPLLSERIEEQNDHAKHITKIMHELGHSGEIITTTDLCRTLIKEDSTLTIMNIESDIIKERKKWIIQVSDLTKEIIRELEDFKRLVLGLDDDESARENLIAINILLDKISDPEVFRPISMGPDHKLEEQLKIKGFKLYLAILTVLNPNWKRIVMLPTLTSPCHFHHPGGLVICEDADLKKEEELKTFQEIACIPFWPWMLTARTTDREASFISPKLKNLFSAASNDYRHFEYIFGGTDLTLTDELYTQNTGIKFNGVKSLVDLLNENIKNEYKKNAKWKNTSIKQDNKGKINIKKGEVNDTVFWQKVEDWAYKEVPKKNAYYKRRNEERNKRIDGMKIKNGPLSLITIIVPIVPSIERINNFKLCIESYNLQTAIKLFPTNFELIILIDSDISESNDLKIKMKDEIINLVRNQANLMKINNIQIWMSKSDDPIGRGQIRNFGIAKALGNVIQLFDDSIVLHEQYLMEILIRFEHLVGQKLAIVGFKERLGGDKKFTSLVINGLQKTIICPNIQNDWKKNDHVEKAFSHAFQSYNHGDIIDYLSITGNLCFAYGNLELGKCKLSRFFTTAQVAFWKDEIILAGGFHPSFGSRWGMEDTYMGAVLIARGNKIVPCYSALSIDLQHEKAIEKKQLKKRGLKSDNQRIMEELMKEPLSSFGEKRFFDNIKEIENFFKLIYPTEKTL